MIPLEAGDAALEFLEATTDKRVAALLKERFPWLDDPDELDVSGSDVIDQLSVWYSELTSAKAAPPAPTLQEYFTEKMGVEPDRALPACALDSVCGIACVH